MRQPHLMVTACALVLSAQTVLAQPPRAYEATDLGTLGGAWLLAAAMNENGDIVGSGTTADGTRHAFRWTRNGGLEDLGTFGGVEALATGINDGGDIVGLYFDTQFTPHSFLLPAGGTMQPLPDVFQPSAIAANGWFTGMSGGARAFRAMPGAAIQEFTEGVGFGTAINTRGDTTGYSYQGDPSEPGSQPTAFRYSDADGLVDLGTLGGNGSYAYRINATGTVVGEAYVPEGLTHAFRAVVGQPLEDLGLLFNAPFSQTSAYGLNDAGDVVGQASSVEGVVPFRYTDGQGMTDLTPLIPSALRHSGRPWSAIAINASQEILVIYSDWNGDFRSTLLRPRTEDLNPPLVSEVIADPALLSPPNGHMVPVTIGVAVSDEYDSNPSCRITRVIDSRSPFRHPNHDVQITGALTLNLRARRDGFDDRTYAVVVTCTNYFGKSAKGHTLVHVPHP
jgi:probable HAF family extracellular repeat protein